MLLAVILLVGPAFLSSKNKFEDMATLDFVPSRLIDEAFAGGGNPHATPPPPAPAAPPAARSQPEKVREPVPPRDVIKPKLVEADSLEPTMDQHKIHRPEVSTKLVTKKSAANTALKQPSEADTLARQLADQRRRAADLIGNAASNLREDVSPSTSIEEPGTGGGEAYANYGQVVKSIYEHAWLPPDDAANEEAITKVTVTIASQGTVMSSHILRGSGDGGVDSSVQRTLSRVTYIAPFPEGSKDKQRTYIINFNLKAKRLMG